jgi:4-aminobutyrate aminotransferase-like enzyme/Ser/Thr protein kinase RdoA (MazF antagonist)
MAAEQQHAALAASLTRELGQAVTLQRAAGENDNFVVNCGAGQRYVLKLADAGASRARIDFEHAAVEAAESAPLGVALPRLVPGRHGDVVLNLDDGSGQMRCGRLLQFVPGHVWGQAVPAGAARLKQLGQIIGRLSTALARSDCPAAHITHAWDLTQLAQHQDNLAVVEEPHRRRLLHLAFERWAAARHDLSQVPRGVIHGDLNDDNLLLQGGSISGVLDFGDALFNPLLCDLSIALAYVLLDEPQPWAAGAQVLAGYQPLRALSPTEVELLYPLICARLAVSVLTSARRRRLDPGRTAWFVSEARAWTFLERHGDEDATEVADQLAALIDVRPYADRGSPPAELRARRALHTSRAMSLSYDEPLKFIRGRGAYLIDEKGRAHLDLYNNVCHVGHCHPQVVGAAQRAMAQLNTNTRYLTEAHEDYVERLCAKLPPALSVVFMLNSGSEANELALRLARAHAGCRDVVVVDNAYHGHTQELVNISPYKFARPGGPGKPDWVHVTPMPDADRGIHRLRHTGDDVGRRYAEDVGTALVGRHGATYIAETLLSCGGQVIPPHGYFASVFERVRANGGVCILDEVQVGFGRIGSHFWAFEHFGVTPDIVVMGKPIGNGHPMAAVACTPAVAAAFEATGLEFFATFGGNPVSCAIGMAVLDVIEAEGLQDHARVVGAHLLGALRELQHRYPQIGVVRGLGLFAGIEMVDDSGAPSAARAHRTVQALRARRVLTGTDGPHHNVIKIKPPMVVSKTDIDRFVIDLDEVLRGLPAE